MYNWKQTLFAILLLFLSVLTDGFISSAWAGSLETNLGLIVPRLIVLMIIILSFHYKENFMLVSAGIFGFIMDTYYLGFIGTYVVSFILVAYLTNNFKRIIQPNVLSYTLVSVIGLTVVETFVYSIMRILGVTSLSLQLFIVSRLGATLLFNAVIMLVFSYFIHRFILNIMDES